MGTSRVFAATRILYSRLADASWPTEHTNGAPVTVVLGDTPQEPPLVMVRVSVVPVDDVTMEWATNVSRDERFTLLVEIASWYAHATESDAWDHLEALCDVVQSSLVDPTTGPMPLLGDGITLANQPRTYLPSIAPRVAQLPDSAGYGCSAVIRIPCIFRI